MNINLICLALSAFLTGLTLGVGAEPWVIWSNAGAAALNLGIVAAQLHRGPR